MASAIVHDPRSRRDQLGHAHALGADLRLAHLRRVEDRPRPAPSPSFGASSRARRCASSRCLSAARRKPRPNSALSSNSEFDQAGPRPSLVLRPRRHRQVAAVDRRAAGGVGDLQAVAEQLRQQLEVGRLAAAGAGAGELEQRLEELHAAHIGEIDARAVVHRQGLEEGDVGALGLQQRRLVAQVDRLERRARSGCAPGRPRRRGRSRCSPRRRTAA